MAQVTSELWETLWQTKNTEKEYGFEINGVWYGPEAEVDHSVDSGLYESFGIGNASIAQMSLSVLADDIPRGATIKRYIRLKNGEQKSEWLPKGEFFTNRRTEDDGYWSVEAYDAMRKAEVVWVPDQSLEFPMPMPDAVSEFARIMGVDIDSRTTLNSTYTIDYPANEYTIRDELCYIAAAHAGNWIITDAGKLLLVPLISIPEEAGYLVDERGDPISFGSTKILISEEQIGAETTWENASKFFVGLQITGFNNNGKRKPISRVTLWLDDSNCLTSGDDSGTEIEADCPHATQNIVDAVLARVSGYKYQAYSASDASLDPAAELGDGVSVNGIYSVIARIEDDGSGYPSISAPGEEELEDEYPASGPMTQEFNRNLAKTRSLISKTAEDITLQVESLEEDLGQTLRVAADGVTITNAAGSEFVIDGGQIKAESIESSAIKSSSITADKLSITGAITFEDLDAVAQATINNAQSTANAAQLNASNALSTANSAKNTVSGWQYGSTAYIDGSMLMIGTVKASSLQGGSISLLNSSGSVSGTLSLTAASSSNYAVDLTSNAALRLTASSGQAHLESGSGFISVSSEPAIYCRGTLAATPSGTYYCGNANYKWSAVYATTGTIQTSDRNAKHDIQDLPDKYLDLLLRLQPKIYKLNDGTSDRYHVGYIAQDVEEAMDAVDVNALEFAGFVKDKDKAGNDIYMLRYEEFIAIHTLAIQRIFKKLEAASL